MNSFRRHIKLGSSLALIALAFQFVFACGHTHVAQERLAPVLASPFQFALLLPGVVTENGVLLRQKQEPAGKHDHDPLRPLTDTCTICAVIAMAASALCSMPPGLLPPATATFRYLPSVAEFAHIAASQRPFQPRAPPLS